MAACPSCLNGCGGTRADCPLKEWQEPDPKLGRPSTYLRETADLICQRLADGESLRSICRLPGFPPRATVQGWIMDDLDGFSGRYARARDLGLEEMADELIDISDDGRRDYTQSADGREVPDHDHIQRSKLRVDTRKWILAKRMPKVFGERLDLNATVKREAGELTDAELAAIASAGRAGAAEAQEDTD